jgi:toxin ParE1/3/4
MNLEWSAIALADLDRFAAFLYDRHPRLAQVIATEIKKKARLLQDHPLLGRAIEGKPQYRLLIGVIS